MSSLIVEVPDRFLEVLGDDPAHAPDELRLAAAMQFYSMGRLSASAAAEFAGVSLVGFICRLADFGIPAIDMTDEELEHELRFARQGGG
jgi:predicted HTH domain antitoxin